MTKDIPVGTRVTVAPGARLTPCANADHTDPVDEEVYREEYLEIEEAPDSDGDYYLTSGTCEYYVNRDYVSVYMEEKTVTDEVYEKTYESFVEWADLNGLHYVLEYFEAAVEESKPKPGEVWSVDYYGNVRYLRMNEEGVWLTADGCVKTHQGEVKPIKKIGVDE